MIMHESNFLQNICMRDWLVFMTVQDHGQLAQSKCTHIKVPIIPVMVFKYRDQNQYILQDHKRLKYFHTKIHLELHMCFHKFIPGRNCAITEQIALNKDPLTKPY